MSLENYEADFFLIKCNNLPHGCCSNAWESNSFVREACSEKHFRDRYVEIFLLLFGSCWKPYVSLKSTNYLKASYLHSKKNFLGGRILNLCIKNSHTGEVAAFSRCLLTL